MNNNNVIKKRLLVILCVFLGVTGINVLFLLRYGSLQAFIIVEAFMAVTMLAGTLGGILLLLKKDPLSFSDEREKLIAQRAEHISLSVIWWITMLGLLIVVVAARLHGENSITVPITVFEALISSLVLLYVAVRVVAAKVIR